jgi:hypothetical protein
MLGVLVGWLSDGSWVYSHACWHLPGTFALQYFGANDREKQEVEGVKAIAAIEDKMRREQQVKDMNAERLLQSNNKYCTISYAYHVKITWPTFFLFFLSY